MKRVLFTMLAFTVGVILVESSATSQPPGGKEARDGKGDDKAPPKFELGQLLPPPLVEELKLTEAQTKQYEALQKEVKAKLEKILTAEQKKTVEEFRPRGGPGGMGKDGMGKGGDKGGKGGEKGGKGGEKGGKGGEKGPPPEKGGERPPQDD